MGKIEFEGRQWRFLANSRTPPLEGIRDSVEYAKWIEKEYGFRIPPWYINAMHDAQPFDGLEEYAGEEVYR